MSEKLLIDAHEVAALLDCSVSRVRHGYGPKPVKGTGRRRQWRLSDVVSWVASLPEDETWGSTSDPDLQSSGVDSRSTGAPSAAQRKPKIDPLLERAPRRSKPKSAGPLAEVVHLRPEQGQR